MIREVIFDDGPIQPGERRPLRAWADTPMAIAIRCFTDQPPPPGYKPCQSCGVIELRSGEQTYITADRRFFERVKGELHISIKDHTGDHREFRLDVLTIDLPEPEPFEANM